MKSVWRGLLLLAIAAVLAVPVKNVYTQGTATAEKSGVTAPGAEVQKIAGGFTWAEGPAEDSKGNIYFTDNRRRFIHKMSPDSEVTTFIEQSRGDNGLFIDKDGTLLSCASNTRQIVAINPDGSYGNVLADSYNENPLNSPNDLWVDPKGGIYFTDPFWGRQGGQSRVLYITPDRTKVILASDDMVRPNGVIGSPDGTTLYVTDWDEKKTYSYAIAGDGSLSGRKLFAPVGDDGMTIDTEGNVYLTGSVVSVYNPEGDEIDTIEVPETPANIIFIGNDKQTLLITARTSVYSIRTRTKGL